MKWRAEFDHPRKWRFEIEQETLSDMTRQQEIEGYYLYVFDETGFCTHDHLQDTLRFAQEQALEDYGVPMDAWKELGQ